MKPALILMSHGFLAQEAFEATKFITGDFEGVTVISMMMDDGLEGTSLKLEAALMSIPEAGALIIADVPGGTPNNAAIKALARYDNIRVLSGLNMGMLIEYALSSDEDLDELAESVRDAGLDAVKIFTKPHLEITEGGGFED